MKRVSIIAVVLLSTLGCMQTTLPTVVPVVLTEVPIFTPTPTPSRINSETPQPTPGPATTCLEVTAETLNVRTMPGTDQVPVMRIMYKGERISARYKIGSWWYISPGWIHGAYVEECR